MTEAEIAWESLGSSRLRSLHSFRKFLSHVFVAVRNSEKENNSINVESRRTTLIGGRKQRHGLLYGYHHRQHNGYFKGSTIYDSILQGKFPCSACGRRIRILVELCTCHVLLPIFYTYSLGLPTT